MTARMPTLYIPHGGGPWPFVKMNMGAPEELDALATYLKNITTHLPEKPKAVLVVSAHWEESMPTLMTSPNPPMLYDYYGFPPESYTIQWPAPGAVELAGRARTLLQHAGFETRDDAKRGYDHGTFVPLKLTFPEASVPTLQLSLIAGLDPAKHLALGAALAPLREEGVLIVGSGMSYHNMRGFGDPRARPVSREFDAWLQSASTAVPEERRERLTRWNEAPCARDVHPREEHLLPLMVASGAAQQDRGTVDFSGTFMGLALSAFRFG